MERNLADEFVGQLTGERGGFLGNYILVAETIFEDKTGLHVVASENIAPWTAMGMLSAAMDVVGTGAHNEMHFEDDEDD